MIDNMILDIKEIKHGRWYKRKRGYVVIINPFYGHVLPQIDQGLKNFFPTEKFYYIVGPSMPHINSDAPKHIYT